MIMTTGSSEIPFGNTNDRDDSPISPGSDQIHGDKDILCGRGRSNFNHKGNELFRKIVGKHLNEYVTARSRSERSIVIKRIAEELRKAGCRFLKQDAKTQDWVEPDAKEVIKKIGHALRDAKAKKNKSIVEFHEQYQEERSGLSPTMSSLSNFGVLGAGGNALLALSRDSGSIPASKAQSKHRIHSNSSTTLSVTGLGDSRLPVWKKQKSAEQHQLQQTRSNIFLPNASPPQGEEPFFPAGAAVNLCTFEKIKPHPLQRQDSYHSSEGSSCLDSVNDLSLEELEKLLDSPAAGVEKSHNDGMLAPSAILRPWKPAHACSVDGVATHNP